MQKVMWTTLVVAAMTTAAAAQQPAGQGQPTGTAGQVTAAPDVPGGEIALGTVRISRKVTADGKPLAPGTYQVRLTGQEAKPDAVGQTEKLERWVEFLQRGQVKGREVVSIVPGAEIGQVADGKPPRAGASRVELLKGNDYLRVWINKSGTHYLIHLPTSA